MIARDGIGGLRVEDVAAKAGVSTALLYYHFRSRAGLVEAVIELASEKAPSTALRIASDRRSGYEALEAALLAELDERPEVRDYNLVWGEFAARAVFEPELRTHVRRITQAWQRTVADAITRGIEDGSISAEVSPDDESELLIVLVDGLSIRWNSGSIELDRARELLRTAVERLRA